MGDINASTGATTTDPVKLDYQTPPTTPVSSKQWLAAILLALGVLFWFIAEPSHRRLLRWGLEFAVIAAALVPQINRPIVRVLNRLRNPGRYRPLIAITLMVLT